MFHSRAARGLALAIPLIFAAGCSHLAPAQAPAQEDVVVAEVDGAPITERQLDEWIRNDLFQREAQNPSKLYQLRSTSLDRMISERLVDAARAGSGLERQAWLEAQVEARGGVSQDDIRNFYEQNKERMDGVPLEQISGQIASYLASERAGRVVGELRQQAKVEVHLEPPRIAVAATGPSLGPEQARVTIVEFSDFQCPFCRREAPVVKQVLAKYPEDVRLVYRQLPLTNIHSRAQAAAEASLCAHEQGRFWEYHDKLFAGAGKLGDQDLARMAREIGLDAGRFEACTRERRYQAAVDADAKAASDVGVTGTPAFLVNGILLSGAQPASAFEQIIERELAGGAAAAPEAAPAP